MINALRVVEIMWLVISAISVFEVYNNWGEDRMKAYIFAGAAVLGVIMFFFRRKRRLLYQERKESK
jgi:LPXTG-motif cell wall-anchored protein